MAVRAVTGRPGVRLAEGARHFSLLQYVHTYPEAHPVSYSVITTDCFPGSNAATAEADNSRSPSA